MSGSLLNRIPTLSPEKKRLWMPIVSAFGSAGFAIIPRVIPTGWGMVGGAAWLLASLGVLILINRPSRYNRKALEAELNVLLEYLRLPDEVQPRLAIWAPHIRGQEDLLEQVTNYLPEATTGAGRKMSTSKGIVGYAFRNKKERVISLPEVSFPKPQNVIDHYKDMWGFSNEEASRLRPDRRAHLAVPIVNTDPAKSVLGVVYCDCSDSEVFAQTSTADRIVGVAPFFRQLLLIEGE
jgi:hypothetical protein